MMDIENVSGLQCPGWCIGCFLVLISQAVVSSTERSNVLTYRGLSPPVVSPKCTYEWRPAGGGGELVSTS